MAKPARAAAKRTKGEGEIESAGSEAAFERLRAEAEAIPAERVIPFRADAVLAAHNAAAGLAVVTAQRDALAKDPSAPRPDWKRLSAVVDIASALVFAVERASEDKRSNGSLSRDLKEAWELRQLLLGDARVQARKGVFKAGDVRRIERGSGSLDAAKDCIALAALYREHAAALRGRSAVTAAEVKRAAELGSDLTQRLKPKRMKRERTKTGEQLAAAQLRDRVWTLLVERYALIERLGGWLYGRDLDAHVPSLQGRVVAPKKKPAEKPTAETKKDGEK